jgi:hypothetical protein
MKLKLIILIFLALIMGSSCSGGDDNLDKEKFYIVGFDPCTINQSYRVGFVLISENLNDTLITYSLSDETFKLPASILFEESDTLYKLPESYFVNYRNSIYFPEQSRFEYPIDITFAIAEEYQKVFYPCTSDIISVILPQVIINSASK